MFDLSERKSVSERKQRISERYLIKVVLRHKEQILDAVNLQQDINNIIQKFSDRTGRIIEQIGVEEKDGAYTLKLKVI